MFTVAFFRYGSHLASLIIGIIMLSDIENSKDRRWAKILEIAAAIVVSVALLFLSVGLFGKYLGTSTVCRLSVTFSLGLYAILFNRYMPYSKIVLVCSYYTLGIIMRNISGMIDGFFEIHLIDHMAYNILTVVIIAVLSILIGLFVKKYTVKNTHAVSGGFWLLFLFIIVFNEVLRLILDFNWEHNYITLSNIKSVENLASEVTLLIFIILVYYLIYTLTTYFTQKQELTTLKQKQDEIMADVARANEMYDEIHTLRHEFKNHMLTVRGLAMSEESEKLKNYLDNYLNDDGQALSQIDCGNKVLNNILNYKRKDLANRGVYFHTRVIVSEEIPIPESDITSLLVNLIDNAAEASLKTENPSVYLNITEEKNFCFITVENTVSGNVLDNNPSLDTTKSDKKKHGIGLKVVRNIIKKHDGHINFEQKDGMFIASVMLPL